jgi:uncharacterized YigZ family protein
MRDLYRTLRAPAEVELPKVKGSRFIAYAFPVQTPDQVAAERAKLRKLLHNASHHCYAFRLGPNADQIRFHDDGEPSGTAGQPILRHIEARNLTNVLVIVVRYFGGTKLGTGGLIRAYGAASEAVLERAPSREVIIRTPLRIQFDYADTSPALHTLSQFDTTVMETLYGTKTEMVIAIRQSQLEAFVQQFTEALSGRGEAKTEITLEGFPR